MSLKNTVTPPGIDPGTVRLVAQRLKHYATTGPKLENQQYEKYRLVLRFVLSLKEMRTPLNTFTCYKAYPQI
jgi:hypothetical protein